MKITNNLFETKIQYPDAEGKKHTDIYLVDAVNFGEAETITIEQSLPFITAGYQMTAIKPVKISEVFDFTEGDRWFKVKVLFIILDEEKGTEKKLASNVMVQADDIKEARERLVESMKGTMSSYEVAKIEETQVAEILPYSTVGDEE